jgi:hypothetical protein
MADELPHPPRHPHCRCRISVWSPAFEDGGPSLPESLKREAERSIANGYALESEPGSARLRAAEDLLAGRTRLPKSVIKRTKRNIRAGDVKTSIEGRQPGERPDGPGASPQDPRRPIRPLPGRTGLTDPNPSGARALTKSPTSSSKVRKAAAAEDRLRRRRAEYADQERRIAGATTPAELKAIKQQVRKERRRLEAADARDAENTATDKHLKAIGAPALTEAKTELAAIKADVRTQAARAEAIVVDRLPDGGQLARPPKAIRHVDPISGKVSYIRPGAGGEWDWYDSLSETERKQVARYMVDGGLTPDQIQQNYANRGGDADSIEDSMEIWLGDIRDRDTLRAAAQGNTVRRSGDVTVDGAMNRAGITLDANLELRGIELDDLYQAPTEADAARILADGNIRELANYVDDIPGLVTPLTARPRSYDLTAAEYVVEVDYIETRLAEYGTIKPPTTDAEFLRLPEEVQYLISRRAELLPSSLGIDGLDTVATWSRLQLIAYEAGLKK